MRIVLAAVDASPAARPVVETAQRVADLMGATVEAVHVRDGAAETPTSVMTRAEVPLRLLQGRVDRELLDAIATQDVITAVVGARRAPGGRRPVGRTALHVLEGARKPIVVVPPDAVLTPARPMRRLLVPLEGTATSSRPIEDSLRPLLAHRPDLMVLHVFTEATMPRVLDRPGRDLEVLGHEFLARHLPGATRIELRTGSVGEQVAAVTANEDVDLVVLSWSQDVTAGHAAVIRDVLSRATVPVLMLPVHGAIVVGGDDALTQVPA